MEVIEGEGTVENGADAPLICCLPCGCSGSIGYNNAIANDQKHYFT
jgi:hypothetical protein